MKLTSKLLFGIIKQIINTKLGSSCNVGNQLGIVAHTRRTKPGNFMKLCSFCSVKNSTEPPSPTARILSRMREVACRKMSKERCPNSIVCSSCWLPSDAFSLPNSSYKRHNLRSQVSDVRSGNVTVTRGATCTTVGPLQLYGAQNCFKQHNTIIYLVGGLNPSEKY